MQRASDALDWDVSLRTSRSDQPGHANVRVSVNDPSGQPVTGAAVSIEALHNARASEIIRGPLNARPDGVYDGTFPLRRPGVWEFNLEITRDADRYVGRFRKSVADTRRPAGNRP